jgi:hypothetical protein
MKTKIDPHLLVRYGTAPGKQYTYFGYCGYASEVKKEFIDPTTQKIPANLCAKCLEKLKGGLK